MHDQCGARARSTGKPCTRPAGWGTPHPGIGTCKFHGGCTPAQVKGAERKRAEMAVVTYGLPREVDPHQALLEELHRTAGAVAWLGQVVANLDQDQVAHLIVANDREDGRTEVLDERPSVWIELYQRERRHLAAVAKTCVDVGVEERLVRVAEQQGDLLAQVIRGIAADMGIDTDPRFPGVVRRHLTMIAGGTGS